MKPIKIDEEEINDNWLRETRHTKDEKHIESTVTKNFDIHPSNIPKNKGTNLNDELRAMYDAAAEAMKEVIEEELK